MPDTYRVRIDWSLLDGAERASQTLHFLGPDADLLTLMTALTTAVNTNWLTIDQNYDLSTKITRIVGSRLQDVSPWHAVETVESPINLAGTQNTSSFPPQIAVVASLRTASAARSGRGRIYFPPPITTKIDSESRIPAGTVLEYAQFTAALLQAVNNIAGDGWSSVVFSKSLGGGHTPITSVNVGNVYDTQRRRRDDLIESRQSVNVTP